MQYSGFYPTFWNGRTGKAIISRGHAHIVVAIYVWTNQHVNPLGLYYLPLVFVSHQTMTSPKIIEKVVDDLVSMEFISYDKENEFIWVHEMAKYQILKTRKGDVERLKKGDNRIKWVNNLYNNLPSNIFLGRFYDKYMESLRLVKKRCIPVSAKEEAPEEVEGEPTEKEIDDIYLKCSLVFHKKAQKILGEKLVKVNDDIIENGAKELEKLVRIDHFKLEEEVIPALMWALEDDFWQDKIRSLARIRNKSNSNGQTKFTNLFAKYAKLNRASYGQTNTMNKNICKKCEKEKPYSMPDGICHECKKEENTLSPEELRIKAGEYLKKMK